MIRRIRFFRVSSPGRLVEGFLSGLTTPEESQSEGDSERSLDLLLKHAMQSPGGESDGSEVWQQLRHRVTGPFGRLAVESPALSNRGSANDENHLAPFALDDWTPTSNSENRTGAESVGETLCTGLLKMPQSTHLFH